MISVARLKIFIVNKFPIIASISRYFKAIILSKSPTKTTYSQHKEDVFILQTLQQNFPGTNYTYIDIGGFHPMLISNTYLLYRNNISGIVIEPNKELARLHKKFRPNDIQLQVACSNENKISKFQVEKTFPALSSLNKSVTNKKVEVEYVPVFTLDTIYKSFNFKQIHFLSIDVEGFDYEVLEAGTETLKNTFLVCIECNDETEEQKVTSFLEDRNFVLIEKYSCNLFFKNNLFSNKD